MTVVAHWPEFHGQCLLRGLDPLELPLPSFLDVAYAWLTDGAEAKDRARFDFALQIPPPSADLADRDEWSDDQLDGGFARAMQAVKGHRDATDG